MIQTIEGDLLDFPGDITCIAHGCNTLNLMRSGLAKQMVARYPEAKAADDRAAADQRNVLGCYSFTRVHDQPCKYIYNLYQQDKLRQLNEFALETSLANAMFSLSLKSDNPEHKMGVPYKIGCGLAAGNWVAVKAILVKIESRYPGRLIIIKRPLDT